MLKGLLLLSVSLLTMHGYSQDTSANNSTGFVPEDSNNIITHLNYMVSDARVIVNWKVRDLAPEFFAIERSDNGKTYEVITVLTNLSAQLNYQWTDDSPKKGRSFYRIRYSFKDGPPLYSSTISCQIAGYIAFKFYPNPVDQILIIRADMPLDVTISDASGKIRIPQTRVQGLQTINVSTLEKGIYLIRFSNKQTNTVSQEKLIKN